MRVAEGEIVKDAGSSLDHSWGDYNNNGAIDLLVNNPKAGQPNKFFKTFAMFSGGELELLLMSFDIQGPKLSPRVKETEAASTPVLANIFIKLKLKTFI